MAVPQPVLDTIQTVEWEARCERLERANRRWKRSSAALCGLLVLLAMSGLHALGQNGGNAQQPKADENAQQSNVEADDHDLPPSYSNFCRVSGTPEEVIFDFGMNPQPFNNNPQRVRINQKIVMSYYTAKRFAAALVMTVQRHEKTFGPIELDVRKRVQNGKSAPDPGA